MLSPVRWTCAVMGVLVALVSTAPAHAAMDTMKGGPQLVGATPHELLATFAQASNDERPGFVATLRGGASSDNLPESCWPTAIGAYLPSGTSVGRQRFNEAKFRNEWRYQGRLIIWDGSRFISRARQTITVAVWCASATPSVAITNLQ